MSGRDERPAIERAQQAAAGLKPGTWESVEALALLAVEVGGADGRALCERARDAAAGLSEGDWRSVRALALLARAGRILG
jgi:hypothetical protein